MWVWRCWQSAETEIRGEWGLTRIQLFGLMFPEYDVFQEPGFVSFLFLSG